MDTLYFMAKLLLGLNKGKKNFSFILSWSPSFSTVEIGGKSHFFLIYCKVVTCFFLPKIKKNCLFSSTLRLSRPIIWTQNECGATTRSHPGQVFLEFVGDRKAFQPRPAWGLNKLPPLPFRSRKFGDIFSSNFAIDSTHF